MSNVSPLGSNSISGFDTANIEWFHLVGDDTYDYPIDYWIAILGSDAETGRVDFLGKWEPNSYCHFHRHVGETTTIVLEGEHHLVDESDTETVHKTRQRGSYAKNPPGEVHMEYAGPEGSVLFFSMEAVDGKVFDILDRDENVLMEVSVEDFVSGVLANG